jgi:hypothetical protein
VTVRPLPFLGLLLVVATQPAAPAPPPHPGPPVTAFRTQLVAGDAERSWTVCWSRWNDLDYTGDLVRNGTKVASLPSVPVAFGYNDDAATYGRFDLPQGVAVGSYTLDVGASGPLPVPLTVTADVLRKPSTIAAGRSAGPLLAAIRAGNLDVTLAPGLHEWDATIPVPANLRLTGYGATVKRLPTNNLGTNWPALWVQGKNVTVRGVTFEYDQSPGQVFFANPPMLDSGLVVADCVFRRVNFGFFFTDALIRDCRFESAGAVIAPAGLWLRCLFTGPPTMHAWDYWSINNRPVATVDCEWRGTDRGRVYNSGWGPITDHLHVGTKYRDVYSVGGGELDACEGPGEFARHVILHTQVSGCLGALQPCGNDDTPVRDLLISDLSISGGWGVILWGKDVSGVRVEQFELTGGAGVYCGPGVKGAAFMDGSVLAWRPTRGSQAFQNMSPVALGRKAALVDLGTGNTLQRVTVAGTMQGCLDVQGFGTRPTPVEGKP